MFSLGPLRYEMIKEKLYGKGCDFGQPFILELLYVFFKNTSTDITDHFIADRYDRKSKEIAF